jgi:hypothetical protein
MASPERRKVDISNFRSTLTTLKASAVSTQTIQMNSSRIFGGFLLYLLVGTATLSMVKAQTTPTLAYRSNDGIRLCSNWIW